MTDRLPSALLYAKKGFSVIPIMPNDKKPLIKWEGFQKTRATEPQIREWWAKCPDANVGIITGAISGLYVVDQDDMDRHEIDDYLPDAVDIPTATTPRGGRHYYFKMPEEPLGGGTKFIPGCDARGNGGFVVAPPSVNGNGGRYRWMEGFSILEVSPAPMPGALVNLLKASFAFVRGIRRDEVNAPNDFQRLPMTSKDFVDFFTLGSRDDNLFHAATCLMRGGADRDFARKVLELLAQSCYPPFSQHDAMMKIESALKRNERRRGDISEAIREWVLTSSGFFMTSECFNGLHLTSREEQKAGTLALLRLQKEGILEKHGDRRGCFRVVERDCEPIDFLNVQVNPLDIKWPFGIEKLVKTLPKSVHVVAGEPDAGKSAFLMNFTLLNMHRHSIYYFSSEMGPEEFRERLGNFGEPLTAWKFTLLERASNFADVIRPDAINIIDFLEVTDEFYKVGGYIKDIFDRLDKGIAIIALQKNKGADYGIGGTRGLEKARLYLTLSSDHIIKIVKAKNWVNSMVNPNGKTLEFTTIAGGRMRPKGDWK